MKQQLGGALLRLLGSVAGGLAVYFGYAPHSVWLAPIVGLALLALAVRGLRSRYAALLGFCFGLAQFLPLVSWSNIYVGNVPWIALSTAQALLVAPAAVLIAIAMRSLPLWPLWAAAAWVAAETLRDNFPFGGFAWGTVAFTQSESVLLPLAVVIGTVGLSFVVALMGFGLAALVTHVGHRVAQRKNTYDEQRAPGQRAAIVIPIALIVLPVGAAGLALPAVNDGSTAPTVPVAVIQGNVPEPGLEFNARRRAVLNLHAAQTQQLAADVAAGKVTAPQWVLWPENASDIDPFRNEDAAAVISDAARAINAPILVGAVVLADEPGFVYNQGIVWDPVSGPGDTYTKRRPVPFAEYMPWRNFFRIFSDKVDLITSDFLPGNEPGNLEIADTSVGDVICFEIVEETVVRDVVRGGATMLVVQTNNATFGYTNETYQQQAMSRVRAVEYGRAVLIAATSGVSAVIGPDGSVRGSIDLFTPGYLVPEVPQLSHTTVATIIGPTLRWVLTVIGSLGVLAVARWWRRSAHSAPTGSATEARADVS